MAESSLQKVAFVSSFLPRRCGIATFTADLIDSVTKASKGRFEPLGVAVRDEGDPAYGDPVKFEIRCNVKSDYICAADYINFSNVDLVSVQHEFGLFGGEAGSYLNLLLGRINAPVITTLHTVLDHPAPDYYKSLVDVCRLSDKVITMNERGVRMLSDIYGVGSDKIELIPHGIPDLPFVDNNYYKYKFGMEGRRTILTFGLLNRNKGIEVMLKALPAVIEAEPSVLYVILGMTHPLVIKYEGESYRFGLQRLVKELGCAEHVIFHNRFVGDDELHNFLCAADVYVTPYLSREQLTSGTLSFAVGAGKAVVSTPYWAAEELLSDGRGKLVDFGDWRRLGETVVEILRDEGLFYGLRRKAYDYSRSRTWPRIGGIYWKLFSSQWLLSHAGSRTSPSITEPSSAIEVPEPSLVHLKRLTDDTGLLQHSRFIIPDRLHGYCTDDNARAVIAMVKYYAQYTDAEALELFERYLSFVLHAQKPDGTVRNFMNFDRTWRRNEPASDALGRTLWALGTVVAEPPAASCLLVVKDGFDLSVRHVPKLAPRGMAYAVLGMADYLRQFPGASDIKRHLGRAADSLVALYGRNASGDWQWFETQLTYDNAVLPHALFAAGTVLENDQYRETAEKACEFLLDNIYTGEHFSFIGCDGWYKRGGPRAEFDQQPVEAAGTVMMLRAAYESLGRQRYLALQRKAFDWLLGKNDLGIALYDFKTKGCCDALVPGGVNRNQGAESLLSFMLGLLAIVESYTLVSGLDASGTAGNGRAAEGPDGTARIKTVTPETAAGTDRVASRDL
jgi:glycosyltransferase involved in cell wall biosynthesis